MRIVLTDEQVRVVHAALTKVHREAVDKATSYSFEVSRQEDFNAYVELRRKEMEIALVLYNVKSQMENPIMTDPLADWEKEMLSGGASQKSAQS